MNDNTRFPYTFGLEEEFFLTHPRSRSLATTVPQSLLRACERSFGDAVAPELLSSQLELVSPVFEGPDQALEEMTRLRRGIAEIAEAQELRLMASGTPPIAAWGEQVETPKPRYQNLMDDFQIVGRRNVLCGLHIHVAVPEGVDRVALMNRLMFWVPVFLALSTSAPIWNRAVTGLMSYRQSAYDEWPRTGIPDHFDSEAQYNELVAQLVKAGAVKDASSFWWVIRPALRYPTLELRICDVPTRLEDSLAIAAFYRCLLRLLVRQPGFAPGWSPFTRRLIDENRWRAKRFGTEGDFIAYDGSGTRPFREVIKQLLADVAEDAQQLGCEAQLQQVLVILQRGTSAHTQLQTYREARARGDTRTQAMQGVVDWLTEATVPPAL